MMLPMFGIVFRYVKVRTCPSIDGRKAPAFHTFHNCLFSDKQAKGLLLVLTKRDASLNKKNYAKNTLHLTEVLYASTFSYSQYFFIASVIICFVSPSS